MNSTWNTFADGVYCEACDRWANAPRNSVHLQVDTEEFVRRLEVGDFASLRAATPAPDDSRRFLRLRLANCATCTETNALSVERVKIVVGSDGKHAETTKLLLDRLLLSEDEARPIRELSCEMQVARWNRNGALGADRDSESASD